MTPHLPPIDAIEARLLADGHRVRRIFFRDLVLELPIGIHESELAGPQRVAVNLSLYIRVADPDAGDDIARVFDYDQVRRKIMGFTKIGRINLQETLVEAIADACLEYDAVLGVRAATEKLDVYANCAGVGIEIVRIKN